MMRAYIDTNILVDLVLGRQEFLPNAQHVFALGYADEAQLPEIRAAFCREEEKAGAPLAVELAPLANFFPAEEYHQKYLEKNPGGYCHIPQRMFSLRKD